MICGDSKYQVSGCGHDLDDHNDSMKCWTCGAECGIAPHPAGIDMSLGVYIREARRHPNAGAA